MEMWGNVRCGFAVCCLFVMEEFDILVVNNVYD